MSNQKSVEILKRYLDNPHPTIEEAREVFEPLTVGDYDDVHMAALLIAVRTRGETFEDITGAAQAFLAAGRPFPLTGSGLLDTAGTGGDGKNTINISTAASLLTAAGGCGVVKCGNRSVSSKSGSADVLEALNIPLQLDLNRAVKWFENSNFTFLFAPAYNPAIAHVQPVRKALGVPTLFNILGPLLSPARPALQIMGIAKPELGETIIKVMRELGRERALVVHGSGTDEIAVHGPTQLWELRDGEISYYERTPEELGISEHSLNEVMGGTGEENAKLIRAIFAGTSPTAHLDAVAVNAGAMFYLHGVVDSIAEGAERAKDLVHSGQVNEWLATHEGTDYAELS